MKNDHGWFQSLVKTRVTEGSFFQKLLGQVFPLWSKKTFQWLKIAFFDYSKIKRVNSENFSFEFQLFKEQNLKNND